MGCCIQHSINKDTGVCHYRIRNIRYKRPYTIKIQGTQTIDVGLKLLGIVTQNNYTGWQHKILFPFKLC